VLVTTLLGLVFHQTMVMQFKDQGMSFPSLTNSGYSPFHINSFDSVAGVIQTASQAFGLDDANP